jgi:HAE1 family hydrophobic/amphiphilic exporter-1
MNSFSAVIATSLVKMAVFLPVLFFPGATGTIYKQFAATILFSIGISTFNALTFSPMLAALLLEKDTKAAEQTAIRHSWCVSWICLRPFECGRWCCVGAGPSDCWSVGWLRRDEAHLDSIADAWSCRRCGCWVDSRWRDQYHPCDLVYGESVLLLVGLFPRSSSTSIAFYSGFEKRYSKVLDQVLKARPIVMAALAAGILLTGFAFTRIPGGFVPIEDQGYAIGFVQAPDGVSNETTLAINRQVAEVLRSEDDISAAALFSGASLDGNAPNKGLFFFGTKHWDERQGSEHSVAAIVERLNKKLLMSIDGGRVFVVEPPSIPGYGAGGGFEFQLLDKSSGAYGLNQFFASAGQIMQAGNANPILSRVYTLFSPESPQIEIKVNREKMASLGVDFGSAMQSFSVNFGGAYVNDTFQEGKVRRVYVQADDVNRATPEQLSSVYVNSMKGEQIPLSEFFTVKPTTGPSVIPHFNLYRSIKIDGTPAVGKSSGQAITAMKTIFKDANLQGLGFDWTGISREEVKAGSLAVVIFALGILAVFLGAFSAI